MQPLFKFVGSLPNPWLPRKEDGSPVEPDGMTYFDAAQAAAKSLASEEELRQLWRENMAQWTGDFLDADVPETPLRQLREAFIDRAFSGLSAEQAEDAKAQIAALGGDFVTGEIWATIGEDDRIVICATLGYLERRILESGQQNGGADVEYRTTAGEWEGRWNNTDEAPFACRVSVHRRGHDRPFTEERLWTEVCRDTWYYREQPVAALTKCTKAQAYRTAFRDVIGSLYLAEELPARGRRFRGSKLASDLSTDFGSEVVHTEADCRAVMKNMGVSQRPLQDRIFGQVRALGQDEAVDPDAFYSAALSATARMMSGNKTAR